MKRPTEKTALSRRLTEAIDSRLTELGTWGATEQQSPNRSLVNSGAGELSVWWQSADAIAGPSGQSDIEQPVCSAETQPKAVGEVNRVVTITSAPIVFKAFIVIPPPGLLN